MIVRISRGRLEPAQSALANELPRDGEASLQLALAARPRLIDYYVAIEADARVMVNVSNRDLVDHAQAMATLPEMHVQPDVFLAEDVQFKPIPNHDVLWSIDLDDAVGTD